MAEEQDDSQKTEEPTQRRIEEAVKKGQVISSREVSNFLMLLTFTIILVALGPYLMHKTTITLRYYLESSYEIFFDPNSYRMFFLELFKNAVGIMILPVAGTIIAALLATLVQHGFIVSTEPIMPKLDKISPLSGLKRLFSLRSFMEFVKGIIKITIVGAVAMMAIWPELHKVEELHATSIAGIIALLNHLALRMMIGICSIMAVIAVLDFLYQRFEYLKSLRMSKQDIKDEFKQSEGNPEIKAKLRSLRMERARKRMMAAVPKADVVITNPTHFAVALMYETGKHTAPIVVAKGTDLIALKIREIAEANSVPIVENPPLARALYEIVELDEQIPEEHYKAVAEVIAYVYKLKGKAA